MSLWNVRIWIWRWRNIQTLLNFSYRLSVANEQANLYFMYAWKYSHWLRFFCVVENVLKLFQKHNMSTFIQKCSILQIWWSSSEEFSIQGESLRLRMQSNRVKYTESVWWYAMWPIRCGVMLNGGKNTEWYHLEEWWKASNKFHIARTQRHTHTHINMIYLKNRI